MGEWKKVKISEAPIELIDGDRGSNYPSQNDFQPTGYCLFLNAKNVTKSGFEFGSSQFITEVKDSQLRKGKLKRGDLVLTTRGTVGNISLFNEKVPFENMRINSGMVIIRPNNTLIDQDYCYWSFKYLLEDLDSFVSGSAQPQLPLRDLKEMEIPLPPLPEQKAIAGVLSSLDDKIDLLHRQNKTLEAMAEALFRQWFIEEAEEGWEDVPLKNLLSFTVDNRGKTAPTSESGIPLIATNCVKNNNIFPVYENLRFVTKEIYETWFRAHPKPGDIIFVNKGTPGSINFVPKDHNFCIAQDMIALRVDLKTMSQYFLFLYLRSSEIQSEIKNKSVGTTIPHLKKTDLLEFIIKTPPLNVLKKFDDVVNNYFEKMNLNESSITTMKNLRDSLLPKLMSGEVSIEDFKSIKNLQD